MRELPRVGLSVIAPCFNEEANVATLARRSLAAFKALPVPAELLLIDDGSRDGTWSAIERVTAQEPAVRGARHAVNRGIVGGWKTGLELARYDLVCLIDSDLQNRPEDIPRLMQAWTEHDTDLVQGVRNPQPGEVRTVFSRALNLLLNASFGMNLADNKSGFILTRRATLAALLEDAQGYRYFQSLIGVAAGVRALRFHEVQTQFELRQAGTSFLGRYPLVVSARVLTEVLRYRIHTLQKRSSL
jgi:glycosyltransferase involved in cell wall biosynthesis